MLVLKESASCWTQVKNSRFLAEIFPVYSADEAKEKWRWRKENYDNGGHIVYAFTVGNQQNVSGCSDDGEPSGTAGRPVLAVLQGSGITNAMITIARWFGGTKLGTGGLVHAYGDAAREVVALAACEELIPRCRLVFALPYALYASCRNQLEALELCITSEEFAENVNITGILPQINREKAAACLCELGNGRIIYSFEDL